MGDGPVGTLLVPGLGGNVGIAGMEGRLAQANEAITNTIANTKNRDFKKHFMTVLLSVFEIF